MILAKEAGKKWVKKSLQAYLEGEKDLRWIIGILQGVSKEEIKILLQVQPYGLKERRDELETYLSYS